MKGKRLARDVLPLLGQAYRHESEGPSQFLFRRSGPQKQLIAAGVQTVAAVGAERVLGGAMGKRARGSALGEGAGVAGGEPAGGARQRVPFAPEVFDEAERRARTLSLFPEDRAIPADAPDGVQVQLKEMELRGRSLISPKNKTCHCTTRPEPTRRFSTRLQ